MKEIGIIGGAFNPIHFWHLNLAEWARFKFKLEHVYFIPSGNPPHKKNLLDGGTRFDMVSAAIAGNDAFSASRLEIDREGETHSIDTFKELRKIVGDDARLNFVMGEDNVAVLAAYSRRAEFQSLVRVLVSPRGSYDAARLSDWRSKLPDGDVDIVECPPSNLSSTDVRNWVSEGKPYRYAVPEAVYKFIEEKGLYLPVAQAA